MSEIVKIDKEKLKKLALDSKKLEALEIGGVDNWDWFGDSLEMFWETYDEDSPECEANLAALLAYYIIEEESDTK